jgi:hypothetical protein
MQIRHFLAKITTSKSCSYLKDMDETSKSVENSTYFKLHLF